jgi:hypothetical protein
LDKLELILACITAFLAPINAARLSDIYITLADFSAVLCLIVILANRGVPKRMFGALTGLYVLGLLMFCMALLLSSIINGDPTRGIIGVGQYVLAYLVFPVVLLRRTHKEAWFIGFCFLGSIAVICLHGIAITTFDFGTSERFLSITGRLRGLVERENELGGLLGMSVPLVLVLIKTKWMPFYTAWVLFFMVLYTTMLTGSNTGMACFILGLLGTVLMNTKVVQNLFYLLCGVIVVALIITTFGSSIFPDIFEERVLAFFKSNDIEEVGTLTGRLDLIVDSLSLAESYLFIGMGFDQFRENSSHGAPVHNVILLILNEGGVFALLGFLILLVAILGQASLVVFRTQSLNAGAFFLATVITFAFVISGLAHVYARFLVLPWVVTMGIATTIPAKRKIV